MLSYNDECSFNLIIALARSGYHAISSWICERSSGGSMFLNNVNQNLRYRRREYYGDRVEDYVFSLENFDIKGFEDTFGSGSMFDNIIIVVRDPYNWVASSLRWGEENPGGDLHNLKETFTPSEIPYNEYFCQSTSRWQMWHEYMEEVTGETTYLPGDTMVVNYNKWFSCADYREEVGQEIGFEGGGPPYEYIPNYGNGSSFSERSKDGDASDLKVLERWKAYKDDEEFWSYISPEMEEWGRDYFNIEIKEN